MVRTNHKIKAVCFLFLVGFNTQTLRASDEKKHHDSDPPQEEVKISLNHQSYMGSVCSVDYVSPGLDFKILTQERPGQNYLVDDIENQPFENIWVYREYNPSKANIFNTIRSFLIEGYERGTSKVVIIGDYSTGMALTKGRADGYLLLTAIWIYDVEGSPHTKRVYSLEGGIYGGVCGCMSPPVKKKKTL
jgi:hypothetical protein